MNTIITLAEEEYMRTNKMLTKIKAGEKAVGLQIPFYAPDLVELMGIAGIDYVFVDCEHGSFSLNDVETMCRAAELSGVTPIVRVVNIEPTTILQYIVRGAMGIIGPHIRTRDQAEQLVRACLFSPKGIRSYGNARGDYYGTYNPPSEHMSLANKEMFICGMIEEEEGFNNLSDILKVDGLDFFKFGIHDISLDMKVPGEFDHPKINLAIKKANEQIRAAGKMVTDHVMWEGTVSDLFLSAVRAFAAKGRG
jgi:4-hydroxy-2-oxoheptanedioate aldolase